MKRLFIACAVCILLAGCSSTSFTYVYKSANFNLGSYKKLAVLALLPNDQARVLVEKAVVASMTSQGIHAVTTWSEFVFANKPDIIKQANLTNEQRMEIIRKKVTENNIDALLVIAKFNSKTEERYVPGSGVSVGIAAPGYPVYGYSYYGYYSYAYNIISEPGYYETVSTYFVESNLYDIASEKLLWTGQTSTELSNSFDTDAEKFGEVLVRQMITDSGAGQKK
jgi:hypothetical protein